MPEYSANAVQTVGVNQAVIFTESPVPCRRGLIYHRDESGIFRLANNASNCNTCACGCRRLYETLYDVAFHANIAISTEPAGTVEPIQIAIAIDGVVDPSSTMIITPSAVGEFGNVGTDIIVPVPSLCGCESVSVINTSTQPIDVQNANIKIEYDGVRRIM